jgi:hypothetical protein
MIIYPYFGDLNELFFNNQERESHLIQMKFFIFHDASLMEIGQSSHQIRVLQHLRQVSISKGLRKPGPLNERFCCIRGTLYATCDEALAETTGILIEAFLVIGHRYNLIICFLHEAHAIQKGCFLRFKSGRVGPLYQKPSNNPCLRHAIWGNDTLIKRNLKLIGIKRTGRNIMKLLAELGIQKMNAHR